MGTGLGLKQGTTRDGNGKEIIRIMEINMRRRWKRKWHVRGIGTGM